MTSSLAAQLAQGVSLNAALLVDRSRRKHSESYLFTGREADHHDLYVLHALGFNALLQLKSLNPAFRLYEDAFFSEAAKGIDRTLLQKDRVTELNENISKFLQLLGPYLMDAPTGKVLEWMVRRFRIHEFNIDDILALFLPYHESPHFVKMVTILHIKPQSKWHFLLAYKSATKHISRSALVTEMLRNIDVTRFVVNLLPESTKVGYTHRTLVAFHTSTLLDYISRRKALDEETLSFLLPSFLETLQRNSNVQGAKDHVLSGYILLSALSQKSRFSQKAMRTMLNAVAKSSEEGLGTNHIVNTMLSICAPQNRLEKVPTAVVNIALSSTDFKDSLVDALGWAGSEVFVVPLLANLIGQLSNTSAYGMVDSVLASQNVPRSVIFHATHLLLQISVSADTPSVRDQSRELLGKIRLRHPDVVQDVSRKVMEEDDTVKEKVEQLILLLSLTNLGTPKIVGESSEMIIATTDADADVRAIAVRKLHESISNTDFDSAQRTETEAALLTRAADTSVSVITALYANPSRILSFVPESYLDTITEVLCSTHSSPSRQLVRLHLTFLTHHFAHKYPALVQRVVIECLWPFLAFSKPRQKTAATVWELLKSDQCCGEILKCELLGGCLDAVKWEEERDQPPVEGEKEDFAPDGHSSVDKMARVDLALANRIAENILLSNNFSTHLDLLLGKLQDINSFSRSFSYLVMRALLGRLSGEHQIDAAHRVLKVMDMESLAGMDDFMRGSDNLQPFLHDLSVGTCVVLKPSSRTTINRLKVSILAMIPTIARPMNMVLNWLGGGDKNTSDTRGVRYIDLMHSIYRLANSTTSLSYISAHLLRVQFISLKDDALTFLAGVWASPVPLASESQEEEFRVHQAALHHAAAFLLAHQSTQNWVDFQTVLPLVLFALGSPIRGVREAAVHCVFILTNLCEAEKPTAIYGIDTIYGDRSEQLQFLEWVDLRKYLTTIVEHRHHLASDCTYIQVLQHQCLLRRELDTKKDSAYKRKILCYLLSHISACHLPIVKLGLLRSLKEVSDASKVQMLFSTIQDAVGDIQPVTLVKPFGTLFEESTTLLLSCFDSSAAKALNDPTGSTWPVFLQALRRTLSPGSINAQRDILAQNLEHNLFKYLTFDRQTGICHVLLDIGSSSAEANPHCRKILASILQEIPLVLYLVKELQPSANESAPPLTKRARIDKSRRESMGTEKLGQLTLLTEVLASATLKRSTDLISGLLDTLSKVVHCEEPSSQADIAYLEQLLMSVIENLSLNMLAVDITPNTIQLDVLVEVIRVSDNPQTFHQAMLLMSSLARLAPEAVLRNVMPLFTFMGSNVFHRDDTYSFRVVQKTIDSIVPVMVSSLKTAHATPLELRLASKDFLSIFTDAANHIPRHRRTSFFAHFVDVLGPTEYLAPVCMLLIDKVANRVVRQSAVDAQNSLTTALSLIQHYPPVTQVDVLTQVTQESQRIMENLKNPQNPEPTFLDHVTQNDDDGSSVPSKRRAHALIIFTDNTLKKMPPITVPQQHNRISDLISLLLSIPAELDAEKITIASRGCLTSALNVLPAPEFVSSVLVLTGAADVKVQIGAFEIFSDRVLRMTERFRREVTTSVKKIIGRVSIILSENADSHLTSSTLKALKAISDTLCNGEENLLGDLVPLVLNLIRDHQCIEAAMSALSSVSLKLGARIIPHFRSIVQECVGVATAELEGNEKHSPVVTDSLQVLQGLLTGIPSFWASEEITPVVNMYLLYGAGETAGMTVLAKNMSKRLPSGVLLPTLCEVWKSFSPSESEKTSRINVFFNLLKKSLHAAGRSEVLQHLRPLFNVFLQAFTLHSTSLLKEEPSEDQMTPAFLELVVKLNETAFRPLFRKLYDWAFTNEPGSRKQVVFCQMYMALLDYFKGLMTPYMSYMTHSLTDLLGSFTESAITDDHLWISIIKTLAKSFLVDEGAFWRDDKLRSFAIPLVQQISVCISLDTTANARSTLSECISSFAAVISDEDLLKSVNLGILMQTRSEDSKQRIFALNCAQDLWQANGAKLMGFVPETGAFIAELAEDDNDTVVRETRKLKHAVESVAGSINNL